MARDQHQVLPLNLVFDYPVRWSRFKVLRDFVQNFYDAVGHRAWSSKFSHGMEQDTLWLRTEDTGFHYEWLLHIGASTKREDLGAYAGYFGEGFKIAALCALRDHGWAVALASRDWRIEVTTVRISIEGRRMRSLAYRLWTGLVPRPDTMLWLSPFSDIDQSILNTVLLSFYHEGNPLLSDCLWSCATAAIWTRSSHPKPSDFPRTERADGPGIVFAGYQALGSLEFPLVFCAHTQRFDDRERRYFFRMDVINTIRSTVELVPPEIAAELLGRLSRQWYRYPSKRYDFESWYPIIRSLAQCVAKSPGQAEQWRQRHPDLLVAHKVPRKDVRAYNRRRQAQAWLRRQSHPQRLVQDGFAALGYQTLEAACERAGGFTLTRPPATGREQALVSLLEQTTQTLLPDFFGPEPLPPCRLIAGKASAWMGMAECRRRASPIKTPDGRMIRFALPYVAMKDWLLQPGLGAEALSTYWHELCHMFGGDQSAGFSAALTDLLGRVVAAPGAVQRFEAAWDATAADAHLSARTSGTALPPGSPEAGQP